MELHQIQVIYRADEDRLLCRASFKAEDGLQEVRAWLTRRLIRNLWPSLLQTLETQVALDKPAAAHAKTDIVGMEHQASVETIRETGNFNVPYAAKVAGYPLGEVPILVHQIDFTLHADQPLRITFSPAQGAGFEVALTLTVLHGFCALLKDAVRQAEWDMELKMPGLAAQEQRVLN